MLSLAGRSPAAAAQFVDALTTNDRSVDVTPADRAMLDYALALTHAPHTVTADAVAA